MIFVAIAHILFGLTIAAACLLVFWNLWNKDQ